MAKYTIEVNEVYTLSILAPLAELIELESGKDANYLELYLKESLSCLISELSNPGLYDLASEHPVEWERIAKSLEKLAERIRARISTSNA